MTRDIPSTICSLINGTRGITITYRSCPRRCPKGHGAPAGVVAVVWRGSGQCFVQLSDYKKAGYTGRGKAPWLVVCRLNRGIWFMYARCISVSITARHVSHVSVCDQVSERVWCCYSSSKGRCKKYINTQLGARGYSTPSNNVRATMDSWICHPEESVENMRGR